MGNAKDSTSSCPSGTAIGEDSPVASKPLPEYLRILRQARLDAGMTQSQLADALGVQRSTYSNYENGYSAARPSAMTAERLRHAAQILNMPHEGVERLTEDVARASTPGPPSRPRRSPFREQRPEWSELLIDLRLSRGLTVTAAAEAAGISQQTWTGMETGTRLRDGKRVPCAPKETTLTKIAQALTLTEEETVRLRGLADKITPGTPTQQWQHALRNLRLQHDLSPDECAAIAQVSASTYRSWEKRANGSAQHSALRRLLQHLGYDQEAAEKFMELVPNDHSPARPPSQPTDPVRQLPAWSRMITQKRLELGLYLADVDDLVGQQSVVRRFELGGWKRKDGRLSVATVDWLTRVAAALRLTAEEQDELLALADRERIALAAQGIRPLSAEILHEARKALGLTQRETAQRVGALPAPWNDYENGTDEALASLSDSEVTERIIRALPVRPLLAQVLRASAAGPLPED